MHYHLDTFEELTNDYIFLIRYIRLSSTRLKRYRKTEDRAVPRYFLRQKKKWVELNNDHLLRTAIESLLG
jgi:hypothetical protein